MLLPGNTNQTSACAKIDSSAAFERTTGNTTQIYVLTFESVSATVKDAQLNANQTADIFSAVDALCHTADRGVTTTLCLAGSKNNPCKGLVNPSSVAPIADCPNSGVYLAQAVIDKNANTFNSGIYSLIVPSNTTMYSPFDACVRANFSKAILGSMDKVSEDEGIGSGAPARRGANKKLSLLTCALVGASILAGTL